MIIDWNYINLTDEAIWEARIELQYLGSVILSIIESNDAADFRGSIYFDGHNRYLESMFNTNITSSNLTDLQTRLINLTNSNIKALKEELSKLELIET